MRLAIQKSKANKSPGPNGIPVEIYKYWGDVLTNRLNQLMKKSCQVKQLPQEYKDVLILPIYKNKGNHKDCGNYRGISLLARADNIMAKIVQHRP